MLSSNYYVTKIEREAGDCIASDSIVDAYCKATAHQDSGLVRSVLTAHDRVEIFVTDKETCLDIAMMSIGIFEDIHHGVIAATIANFIVPEHRVNRRVATLLHRHAMAWCKRNGITKFQRSRHIDGNRQLIITKEV